MERLEALRAALRQAESAQQAAWAVLVAAEAAGGSAERVAKAKADYDSAEGAAHLAYRALAACEMEGDPDGRYRVAFEAHGNWLALQSALIEATNCQAHPRDHPAGRWGTYYVPAWAVEACIDLLDKHIAAGGGKSASGGRHARWSTRYREEVADQRRWVVVQWCLSEGLTKEEAVAASGPYLREPSATVYKALARVERRLAAAREYAADEYIDAGAVDPAAPVYMLPPEAENSLGDDGRQTHEDDSEWFAALMRALRDSTSVGDGAQIQRARTLIADVDQVKALRK